MEHPQLAAIRRELDQATRRAQRLTASTTDQTFNRAPAPGAWSVGQCLAHLNITSMAYLPLLDAALAEHTAASVTGDFRYRAGLIGRLLAWSLEPPYRMKTKTAPDFAPAQYVERDAVLDDFVALQTGIDQRVVRSTGRDLNRMRIRSPFNARVQYNVYAAFLTLLAHERRHLWQAEEVLRRT
jgi:hypothetical protein